MKRITMAFVLFILLASCINADKLVTENNLSVEYLKNIFKKAYYNVKTVKKDTFIKDRWKIYLDIDRSRKRYITFSVYWKLNPKFSYYEKLNLVNLIDKEVLMVSPYVKGNVITVKYDLWIQGGSTEKNIIKAYKCFHKALKLILKKDTKFVIK